jgi:hypothetical protein
MRAVRDVGADARVPNSGMYPEVHSPFYGFIDDTRVQNKIYTLRRRVSCPLTGSSPSPQACHRAGVTRN